MFKVDISSCSLLFSFSGVSMSGPKMNIISNDDIISAILGNKELHYF